MAWIMKTASVPEHLESVESSVSGWARLKLQGVANMLVLYQSVTINW